MSGWCGSARAISRKTVSPPTPESKIPMALLVGTTIAHHHPGAAFALDVVLLDLLVEIRPRSVDGLGGLGHVPAVFAQLGQDERLLRLVLELLQRVELHGGGDD